MPDGVVSACPVCRTPHAQHFIVHGRTLSPWRGKSFDADAAVGRVGLAMMGVLEMDPQNALAFRDFTDHVTIHPYPGERTPGHAGTDKWDVHVGVSGVIPEALLPALAKAAEAAVRGAPGFVEARLG